MKIAKTILLAIFLCLGLFGYSQSKKIAAIEISANIGYSNDLGSKNLHNAFSSFEKIKVNNKSFTKSRNISFAFTKYFNPKNGLKISCGYSQLGFDYTGVFDVSQSRANGSYRIQYTEYGISYVRRIPISATAKFILEPGLIYHSDVNHISSTINLYEIDAFSFSSYTGLEIPMIGENFFTSVGLLLKLPLQKYNSESDVPNGFYPYFIGLKIGINFQF